MEKDLLSKEMALQTALGEVKAKSVSHLLMHNSIMQAQDDKYSCDMVQLRSKSVLLMVYTMSGVQDLRTFKKQFAKPVTSKLIAGMKQTES